MLIEVQKLDNGRILQKYQDGTELYIEPAKGGITINGRNLEGRFTIFENDDGSLKETRLLNDGTKTTMSIDKDGQFVESLTVASDGKTTKTYKTSYGLQEETTYPGTGKIMTNIKFDYDNITEDTLNQIPYNFRDEVKQELENRKIKRVNDYLQEHPEITSFEQAEVELNKWDTAVNNYHNNHPYLSRDAAEQVLKDYYNYSDNYDYDSKDSYLELFTFNNVGQLATGVDSSTALYELADKYYGDYDELHNVLENEDWLLKANQMLSDANSVIEYFDDFKDFFNQIDGETGEILKSNLELCMDDLNSLKTYITENVTAAADQVARLEEILKYRDSLVSELNKTTIEKDTLVAAEPSKTIPCQHFHQSVNRGSRYASAGYYEHPNGDDNPEHTVWEENVKKLDMKIVELKKSITTAEYQATTSIGKIKAYDAVVVKFTSQSTWRNYYDNNVN